MWTATARPFSSIQTPGQAAGAVEEAGEFGADGGDARVRGGGLDGAGDGVPAFGAVVPEDDEVFEAGDSGEAAVADGDPGGAAGHDGDGGDLGREGGEGGHGTGVGAGLFGIGDDLGERAVEIEGDDGFRGPREERVQTVAAGRGGRVRKAGDHAHDPTDAGRPRLRGRGHRLRPLAPPAPCVTAAPASPPSPGAAG